jgi:hypothetical protein
MNRLNGDMVPNGTGKRKPTTKRARRKGRAMRHARALAVGVGGPLAWASWAFPWCIARSPSSC